METNTLLQEQAPVAMAPFTAYQEQLLAKLAAPATVQIAVNPDTQKLMAFNGYYTLGNAPSAFLAVDTNMAVYPNVPDPVYDLSLLVSLDGKTSARFPFTGTFDGTQLVQQYSEGKPQFQITFTRTDGADGTTAACFGSITLPGQPAVAVSGTTYNNLIPASLFAGDYYVTPAGGKPVKAMQIGTDNAVTYDYGTGSGELKPVPAYVYNMNMYFFTFQHGPETVNLIMGTAAVNGFACNNMTVTSKTVVTRSFLTIPEAAKPAFSPLDLSSCKLADFSGYYQTPTKDAPLAFVSVQANFVTAIKGTGLDLYYVMISVSPDGQTATGYYFDPFTMTFDGTILNMPEQGIKLTFNRAYNPTNGSLVSLSGTIGKQAVSGSTLFNPVPLSAFGGVPMTDATGDSLTVTNDNSVTYNGQLMDSIIYVPLMYILAYPAANPTTVMSFGTSGLHGNTCIVTEIDGANQKVSVVSAILGPQ